MKRLAHHLRCVSRPTWRVRHIPDLVESDFREAATHERYHATDVPHIHARPRRVRMAAPLQQRQRHQMETFAHARGYASPGIPDMLGRPAVRWAASLTCARCARTTPHATRTCSTTASVCWRRRATDALRVLWQLRRRRDAVVRRGGAPERDRRPAAMASRVFARHQPNDVLAGAAVRLLVRRDVFGVGDDTAKARAGESNFKILGRKGDGRFPSLKQRPARCKMFHTKNNGRRSMVSRVARCSSTRNLSRSSRRSRSCSARKPWARSPACLRSAWWSPGTNQTCPGRASNWTRLPRGRGC